MSALGEPLARYPFARSRWFGVDIWILHWIFIISFFSLTPVLSVLCSTVERCRMMEMCICSVDRYRWEDNRGVLGRRWPVQPFLWRVLQGKNEPSFFLAIRLSCSVSRSYFVSHNTGLSLLVPNTCNNETSAVFAFVCVSINIYKSLRCPIIKIPLKDYRSNIYRGHK